MDNPTIAVTIGQEHYARMFSHRAWDRLNALGDVVHHPGQAPATKPDLMALLPQADACITSWEVAPLDSQVIEAASSLKIIVHLGGSVKRYLSEAVWERRIQVSSAAPALAIDVAETTLGLIIMALKRAWPLSQTVRDGGWRDTPRWPAGETFGRTIGIVGAGAVGRHVIHLLHAFDVEIMVYDPFLKASDLGLANVRQVGLEDLLQSCDVVTLHAPEMPSTYHLLDADRLSLMKADAVLVNTARGSLIDEKALTNHLAQHDDFFAFLDVTDPEPPDLVSPLRQLPNVIVTPHIAGCIRNCARMSEWAAEELRRFFAGEPLQNEIRPDAFDRIA